MSWNYRIATKMSAAVPPVQKEPIRLFQVIECYYDKEGKPDGYGERDILANWETLEDLTGTIEYVMMAKSKPVIDLDNFPNEYKSLTTKK